MTANQELQGLMVQLEHLVKMETMVSQENQDLTEKTVHQEHLEKMVYRVHQETRELQVLTEMMA